MNMTEAVQEGLKALVLPELKAMATELAAVRLEQARQGGQLDATNHRLTDMHDILVLLTQRQDALSQKNDELRNNMDARFQEQRRDLEAGLGGLRNDTEARFQELRNELDARFDRLHGRIDALIQVMVKPEEFGVIRMRVERAEERIRHMRRAPGQ